MNYGQLSVPPNSPSRRSSGPEPPMSGQANTNHRETAAKSTSYFTNVRPEKWLATINVCDVFIPLDEHRSRLQESSQIPHAELRGRPCSEISASLTNSSDMSRTYPARGDQDVLCHSTEQLLRHTVYSASGLLELHVLTSTSIRDSQEPEV
ncbi:hypothetical protein J6590_023863 [Homalodisca vitripennis]|nr:hypothetical protein J6590_023863 [Homalodisca vitripennis]